MTGGEPRIYQYFVDREGDWWCEGWPVDDPDLRDQLSCSLYVRDDGLHLRCEGEEHPVAVEVAPLFVQDVECELAPDGGLEAVTLRLSDGRTESLRGSSLRVDGEGRLFCEASPAELPALFFRPAFYRLMQYLEEDDGRFFIRIGDRGWTIQVADATGSGGTR